MSSTTAPALPDTPAELLRAVRDLKKTTDRADVEMMRLAVHWADLHLADPEFAEACFTSPKTFAGEGSPAIDEFCVPEFATMLGRTNDTAGRFLTDCVEVAYRLPRLWAAVQAGLVAGWRARLIAQTTLALTPEAATYVDEQVFWCASRLTPSALGRLVDEARVPYMPEQVEQALERSADKRHVTFDTQQVSFDGTINGGPRAPRRVGARGGGEVGCRAPRQARLHRHHRRPPRHRTRGPGAAPAHYRLRRVSAGRGRTESCLETSPRREAGDPGRPVRPLVRRCPHPPHQRVWRGTQCPLEQAGQRLLSVEQIRAWCGRPDVAVTVNPVIDLRERLECLGYEPTAKIREQVIVRDGTCVFPWCGRNARNCDLDHIVPYDHDHPDRGGPTSTDNLAALCRRHHRLKTHGRWRYEMTDPGVFIWTSPSATRTCATTPAAAPPDGPGPSPASAHPPDE